jgi:hypothetical protein
VPTAQADTTSCPGGTVEAARFPVCGNFRSDRKVWIGTPAGGVTIARALAPHASEKGTASDDYGIIKFGEGTVVEGLCSTTSNQKSELTALAQSNNSDLLCCPTK